MAYPEPLERLIALFERFPGVGRRTAERLSFHILRDSRARQLGVAIEEAVQKTRRCGVCFNIADADPCRICSDPKRNRASVLVVEEPRDVEAVERSGAFHGVYHVLMGALNPADGTEEHHLQLEGLLRRATGGELQEVILGTDPDAEGEATALLVLRELDRRGAGVKVTRLARGLPAGSALEFLHRGVLDDALEGRVLLREGRGANPI